MKEKFLKKIKREKMNSSKTLLSPAFPYFIGYTSVHSKIKWMEKNENERDKLKKDFFSYTTSHIFFITQVITNFIFKKLFNWIFSSLKELHLLIFLCLLFPDTKDQHHHLAQFHLWRWFILNQINSRSWFKLIPSRFIYAAKFVAPLSL